MPAAGLPHETEQSPDPSEPGASVRGSCDGGQGRHGEATNCCCSVRAAIESPWSQRCSACFWRQRACSCGAPSPNQRRGELLTGADAGLVVVGSEGALQPLRQLLFPPIGTCRNRQHQSQGSNTPEPKQQLTQPPRRVELNVGSVLWSDGSRSTGPVDGRLIGQPPSVGWDHVRPERRSLISS